MLQGLHFSEKPITWKGTWNVGTDYYLCFTGSLFFRDCHPVLGLRDSRRHGAVGRTLAAMRKADNNLRHIHMCDIYRRYNLRRCKFFTATNIQL